MKKLTLKELNKYYAIQWVTDNPHNLGKEYFVNIVHDRDDHGHTKFYRFADDTFTKLFGGKYEQYYYTVCYGLTIDALINFCNNKRKQVNVIQYKLLTKKDVERILFLIAL